MRLMMDAIAIVKIKNANSFKESISTPLAPEPLKNNL